MVDCGGAKDSDLHSSMHNDPSPLPLSYRPGRDKLCRLIQYSSKAMKWRCEESKSSEADIKMWNELMASMSLVRKVLRFFKSIAVLRQLRAAVPEDSRSARFDSAIEERKNCSHAVHTS